MKKYLSILVCSLILSQCNQVQQPNLETKDAKFFMNDTSEKVKVIKY